MIDICNPLTLTSTMLLPMAFNKKKTIGHMEVRPDR